MEDVEFHERMWVDVPLGGATAGEPFKDSEARIRCSWLACIPSAVLASPMRVENSEWYAGLKRKKINGGRVPGFKSRKRDPQYFVCWRNQNKTGNAVYHQVSRKRGVVVITGTVKKEFRKPGETGCRWMLSIHVRVSQPVRDYTSVAVNWTERTLAFTNEPSPIRRNTTGKQTGIDRGCVHTLALSNGTMLDMPQPSERERREYLRLQRKLARQDTTNSRRGGKTAKFQSKRRKLTLKAWRNTLPAKPVFHGKVPLKRQPLPHMWEDSPNRGLSHMRQESPGFSRGEEVKFFHPDYPNRAASFSINTSGQIIILYGSENTLQSGRITVCWEY